MIAKGTRVEFNRNCSFKEKGKTIAILRVNSEEPTQTSINQYQTQKSTSPTKTWLSKKRRRKNSSPSLQHQQHQNSQPLRSRRPKMSFPSSYQTGNPGCQGKFSLNRKRFTRSTASKKMDSTPPHKDRRSPYYEN